MPFTIVSAGAASSLHGPSVRASPPVGWPLLSTHRTDALCRGARFGLSDCAWHMPPSRSMPYMHDLPKRRALPNRHPGRGGAKHPFETKTRVPKRSAALTRQKSAHRTNLRFAWDCPDIALKPPSPCPPRSGRVSERPNLPNPKPPAPQSPCLQPRRSFPKAPNLADRLPALPGNQRH